MQGSADDFVFAAGELTQQEPGAEHGGNVGPIGTLGAHGSQGGHRLPTYPSQCSRWRKTQRLSR